MAATEMNMVAKEPFDAVAWVEADQEVSQRNRGVRGRTIRPPAAKRP
jgi:hypothetical protein